MKSTAILGLTVASLLLGSGCVVRETRSYGHGRHGTVVRETTVVAPGPVVAGEVYVSSAPPPPRVEVRTVSPGPGYIWIGGSWAWNGRWTWENGRWDRPPRRGASWHPHRHYHRDGHHVWMRGGWH